MQDEAEKVAAQIKVLQAQLQPYADRLKALSKLVSQDAAAAGIGPDQAFTAATSKFMLKVGKAGSVRTVINMPLVMTFLGPDLFFAKCTIALATLDQHLSHEQKQQVLKIERVRRKVAILPLKSTLQSQ
jgi:hypothetical protein